VALLLIYFLLPMPHKQPHANAQGSPLPIAFKDILAAAARIKGIAHRTPVLTSSTANALSGASVFFKCENFQRMGAFKFRGAYNAVAHLTPAQRKAGVIAFSSGNHGQGLALAAKIFNVPAVVVMPADAPALKIQATRSYGAEVVLFDRFTDSRERIGERIASERGMRLIPPFNHPDVMAGAGTAALELIQEVGALDVLLVCVGGGGLISGCAVAARALLPACKVYGVEPETGNDAQQSLQKGEIVRIDVPLTLADGAQTQALGLLTFPVIKALATDILTVSDAALLRTFDFFLDRMKMIVEPTGCLAAAAALAPSQPWAGLRVGVIVSGGNADVAGLMRLPRG
jgi:threo-3-hydroxy-L-aspartate ammonia-lyase